MAAAIIFAAKAALVGLACALAVEHGPDGVPVNAVSPGGAKTAMAGDEPEVVEVVEEIHTLKRVAEPEKIAAAALDLLSNGASFVTGSAFMVDGGNSICKA